ncbi:hypothetical protein [Streptomyces sp. NPDC088182]|uniref:hypothetical protein n=1 Tax=Streptomyces sp. NPDC088182 TaxID=3365838 RepID=UPI0037FDBBFA
MPRIRILEAVAGADFSWAPGDLVDLPEDQADSWADGHRAECVDDAPADSRVLGPAEVAPVVTTVDGAALRVVDAVVEEVEVPGADGGRLAGVRWSVTVVLPNIGASEEADASTFDPGEHSNREVLAYLATAGEREALRVLDAESAGQDRSGIGKEREQVLARARARDEERAGDESAAEKAADISRGGGRGEGIETR